MSYNKINININTLKSLYYKKGFSFVKIGQRFNCSGDTIRNRLKECNLPFKTKSEAHIKYKKNHFNGDDAEKAYLLGFRLGDLNVYKPNNKSHIFVVRCHTTSIDQVNLFCGLFCLVLLCFIY